MRAYLLFHAGGAVLLLSKHSIQQPELLERLAAWGKFIAHEVPIESVKAGYRTHFDHVLKDSKQSDDMRVLDQDCGRILTNISLKKLGNPFYHEPE